jgi:cellulose biosynthesis protein BcsE
MDSRKQPAHELDEVGRSDVAAGAAVGGRSRGLRVTLRNALRTSMPAGSRLGIDDLPDEVAQLAPGKFYAIYAKPRTTACDALIWGTAKAAATRHVTIVLSRTRGQAAARMHALGFSASGAMHGWPRNLNVLAMPGHDQQNGDFEGTAPPAGSSPEERVPFAHLFGGLRALKRFGFRANALYVVEGAERWLTWSDAGALAREGRLLANWCEARRIALVLLLDPSKIAAADTGRSEDPNVDSFMTDERVQQAAYLEFHGACAGVARMGRTHGELLWHVDFWRAGRALATGETRALRFTHDGRLSVAPNMADSQAQAALRLARDEARVVATRAVVTGENWVPAQWEIVDDERSAVAACAGAQAATVLLDYRDRSTLESLCAAVHTLRRECGRALKIVVVERREALRHQYELLLLGLGANLIVGRELPFSRVQSLLLSLQGQLDTRPIAADYQAALAAALTDDVRGYLPVAAFCERVEAVLARGAVLDLPHVLAKLTLLPDVAHTRALQCCAPRRAGDVATADSAHLYVFLFACRLSDADAALQHVFTVPVEHLSDRVVYLAEASIGREVQTLADANRRAPIADYSDLFPSLPMRAPHRDASAVQAPNASNAPIAPTPPPRDARFQPQPIGSVAEKINDAMEAPVVAVQESTRAGHGTAAGLSTKNSMPRAVAPRRKVERCPMPLRGERVEK